MPLETTSTSLAPYTACSALLSTRLLRGSLLVQTTVPTAPMKIMAKAPTNPQTVSEGWVSLSAPCPLVAFSALQVTARVKLSPPGRATVSAPSNSCVRRMIRSPKAAVPRAAETAPTPPLTTPARIWQESFVPVTTASNRRSSEHSADLSTEPPQAEATAWALLALVPGSHDRFVVRQYTGQVRQSISHTCPVSPSCSWPNPKRPKFISDPPFQYVVWNWKKAAPKNVSLVRACDCMSSRSARITFRLVHWH